MNQKRKKLRRKLLSFLLTLAMVVGQMPGMSLTAYADNTEELLTTLTFGGSSTYSETTSGVVSVTATNVTHYDSTYGWLWFDEGSLSVTAEEGYTITKCVFRQNGKTPITDTEAPFEIHSVDWGYIAEDPSWDMDGVTSIEVYGPANPTTVDVTDASLNKTTTTLTVGDTETLTATVSPDNATDKTVTWSSDNTAVATVSDGVVTAVAEGSATITVTATNGTEDTSDDKTATCAVTVNPITYTVTYSVVNGTWSDGTTADKTETVQRGSAPASVPTGMKASDGYTGGAWDSNPTDASINEVTTFTYTFDAKTAATVTKAPEVKTLTYNGEAQDLVTAGKSTGGEMQYALGDANGATQPFTTSIPAKTNAGTYYVWYKAVGDDDHIDTTPAAVTVTVGKADLDLSVSLEGWAYGAKANTPEVTGNTGKGTVTYSYKAKDADDKNYSDAVPTVAGTYTVKATVAETDNYNAGTATADFTISKEDGPSDKDEFVVTKAPTAKTLTYTGSAQELVTAGTATGGEMQYALGTATEATQPYTTFIPTATEAGTYYVWYRVVGDGFESSARCVTVVINEEEKLKPGDIVVSEGDLVSEPVAETKYVTAEATVNGEKLSVTISENFVNAIAYTGKRIDAVAHLSMSIDKTPIVSRFKIVDGSSVKPEDLIKVSYVQKYNKRANAAKKSKPTVYARIKVSKDAKKALSREDYKSLKKLVKNLNRELKKNQCNYRINQRSVTACEVKVVAKHRADGKIIVKNGKISGVKKVIVSIDVKDPKTGEITKNTFKLSKKEYSISDPDPENGTVRLTGKRNFTGTVTVKVE